MKLYQITIILSIFTICTTISKAQDGTTSYSFLNQTSSAHVYALGGQNITLIEDDVNMIGQNPALLGPELEMQLGFNYMRYIGGSNYAGFNFGTRINDRSAFAVGIQYFGYGEMTQTESDGTISGKFSPKDVVFNGTYSHDISDRWRGGISAKFVYSSYEQYSAFAICTDLGINYYNPDNALSLSFVAKNLGGQVKRFNDTLDPMPWDLQIGYSQELSNAPFRVSITATNLNKWKLGYQATQKDDTTGKMIYKDSFSENLFRHLVFGVEYIPTDKLFIGIGYNHKTRGDMSTYSRNFLSGFSIGAGMKVKMFGFSVALAQPHSGATTFMLNISTNLYEFKK